MALGSYRCTPSCGNCFLHQFLASVFNPSLEIDFVQSNF